MISMKNVHLNPETVCAPVGTYSQAVRVDLGSSFLLFISGQVAFDAAGNFVGKDNIRLQTEQVFENIRLILKSNDATFEDVVKMNLYVTDMTMRPVIAEIRNKYLASAPPASTFVEVSRLAGEDWWIEVEAVAAVHMDG